MPVTYIAESIPVPGTPTRRPLDDHDAAMVGPHLVDSGESETSVRQSLTMYLIRCTAGMSADRQRVYNAAAHAIADGVDGVMIRNRLFRIRTQERP